MSEAFVFGDYTNYQANLDPGRTKSMFQAKWRSLEKVRLDLGLRVTVNEYDHPVLTNVDNSEAGFEMNLVSLSDLEYQLQNTEERDNSYWIEFSSAPVVNGRNPTGRDFKIRQTYIPIERVITTENPNQVRFEPPVATALPPIPPSFIDFVEDRLELGYDYGAVGGPSFNTKIVETSDGSTSRNALHHLPLGRWQLGDRLLAESERDKLTEISYLKSFHSSRQGSYQGFRYKDWTDYLCYHQIIGIGDGVKTQWQLKKAYKAGDAVTYRPIQKPVPGTVVIYANGETVESATEPGGTGWTVYHESGVISNPEPPATSVVLSASFEFDVPVWFESDEIGFSLQAYEPESGDSIYRLESVFVVEGRIPLSLPWAIEDRAGEITEPLDLGIVYDTIEKHSFSTDKLELANKFAKRQVKRDDFKNLFDIGDRVFDYKELEQLLGYFWNAKGSSIQFLLVDKQRLYQAQFESDLLSLKFEGKDLFLVNNLKLQVELKLLSRELTNTGFGSNWTGVYHYSYSEWLTEDENSKWISYTENTGSIVYSEDYLYSIYYSFYSNENRVLQGRFVVDNQLSNILVNGIKSGISGGTYNIWTDFSLSIKRGFCSLEFLVKNAGTNSTGNPTGLRVEWLL